MKDLVLKKLSATDTKQWVTVRVLKRLEIEAPGDDNFLNYRENPVKKAVWWLVMFPHLCHHRSPALAVKMLIPGPCPFWPVKYRCAPVMRWGMSITSILPSNVCKCSSVEKAKPASETLLVQVPPRLAPPTSGRAKKQGCCSWCLNGRFIYYNKGEVGGWDGLGGGTDIYTLLCVEADN